MKLFNKIFRSFLVAIVFLLSREGVSSARTYEPTEFTSSNTITIVSAGSGTKFKIGTGSTVYDDIGNITVSGGTLTMEIKTPNIIYMSGTFNITKSGKLVIKQDASITGNSVLKRKTGNTGPLVIVDGTSASLDIKGLGDKKRIVFHGNGKFIMPEGKEIKDYGLLPLTDDSEGNVKAEDAIISAVGGVIDLKYVNLTHNYNNIEDITSSGNNTKKTAGGINICVRNKSKKVTLTMDHCNIVGCMARIRGAALYYDDNQTHETGESKVTMTYCEISDCYCYGKEGSVGGQIIRTIGSSTCSLHMINCKIHDNLCNEGSSFGFTATAAKEPSEFIDCEVYDNRSPASYAVSVTANTTIKGCKIHDNYGSGGGMLLASYSGTTLKTFVPYDMNITMDDKTEIYNNEAVSGTGGVNIRIRPETGTGEEGIHYHKLDGSPISLNVTIDGAKVYNNISKSAPAGITVLKDSNTPKEYITNVEILSGTIYGNKTNTGKGGAFNISGSLPVTIGKAGSTLSVYGNEAQTGGAFYISDGASVKILECEVGKETAYNIAKSGNGGGMCVEGGNVVIQGGTFHYNKALGSSTKGNGGGLYVSGGNVKMVTGNFSNNEANNNGGGLFISGGNLSFTKGTIDSNTAGKNGGGVYVAGIGKKVVFNDTTKIVVGLVPDAKILSNKAANGGGLFLASGASMTFKGGIIAKNEAKASEGATAKTAYHGGDGIEGCGGGIYLQSGPDASHKTSLLFELPDTYHVFGLYTNIADKGGDDLVAEGLNTSIVLPQVSDLQLIGFEGQDASPSWYQDYFKEDKGYKDHPLDGRAVENDVTTLDRFRNISKLKGTQYLEHRIPDDAAYLSKISGHYLCLTLSYSMLDITLKANNLLGHETALFQLIRHGSKKNSVYDILLRADDGAEKTLRNMPWGTYSVIPNNKWHYAYDPVEPVENVRIGEINEYIFEFDMHHKNAASLPQHDETQAEEKKP